MSSLKIDLTGLKEVPSTELKPLPKAWTKLCQHGPRCFKKNTCTFGHLSRAEEMELLKKHSPEHTHETIDMLNEQFTEDEWFSMILALVKGFKPYQRDCKDGLDCKNHYCFFFHENNFPLTEEVRKDVGDMVFKL